MTKSDDRCNEVSEPFEFIATVEKVQTLTTTNTIRVWLELPETALLEMARLAESRVRGQVLKILATPYNFTDFDNEAKKESERGSAKVDRRRIGER